MQRVGYTLSEMLVLGEKPNYDFKVAMPPRTEKITKEVCAMTNLPGGGVLLFGISDDAEVVGMNPDDLDLIKLRITTSVRNLCDPIPTFAFFSFNIAEAPDRVILVCQVEELTRKPCLLHGRVYIRSGPSAQAADSEEIRRMVLSGL
jgi:predicted HTH transcriptional regulator